MGTIQQQTHPVPLAQVDRPIVRTVTPREKVLSGAGTVSKLITFLILQQVLVICAMLESPTASLARKIPATPTTSPACTAIPTITPIPLEPPVLLATPSLNAPTALKLITLA